MTTPTRDSTASHLARNIKRLRERRSLTQQELAETSGVPRPTIANLESGSANPTLAVVLRVAETLGTTVEELVSDAGSRAIVHAVKTLPEKRRAGSTLRRLIPEGFRPVEFERLEVAPGSRLAVRAEPLGAREYLACESGDLDLVLGEDVFRVATGDVAALTADQPRDYENRGRRAAVAYRILVTAQG